MKYHNKSSGFTLIELLVAMGLFLVVVILASGTFIKALRLEKQAVDLMAMNDSASLALEQMAREIRTGTNFSSPNSDSLNFTNALAKLISYHFNAGLGIIERSESGGIPESLTALNVAVAKLVFITSGLGNNDDLPARVTVALSVASRAKNLQDIFTNLQTTISPRVF